jgi:AraC-like DNA-binding protein
VQRLAEVAASENTVVVAGEASTLARWTATLVEREIPAGERGAFLASYGLSGPDMLGPGARADEPTMLSIWEALTRDHADPLAGIHFARSLPESAFGIAGYLAATSATALEGLRRVAEFYRLVKGAGAVTVTESVAEVRVADGPVNGVPWPRHLSEAVLHVYRVFIERCTGEPVVPRRVRLQHRAPDRADLVAKAFGTAVTFEAPANEIVFARRDLEVPLLRADPALHRYLLPVAEQLRASMPSRDPVLGALETAVASALSSRAVSLERVAREVGIGVRTLQRRLRDRSLTFQDVVDGVRRDAAARMQADPALSRKEMAFLLGFSDPRALRRAQKRWKGEGGEVS